VPRKAAYRELADDSNLEFDHYLAAKLHMTVRELGERMDHAEYVRWSAYYAREAQRRQIANA
jgi:hypothetical protein